MPLELSQKTVFDRQVFEPTCKNSSRTCIKRFLPKNFRVNDLAALLLATGDFPTGAKEARELYKEKNLKQGPESRSSSREERG